MTLGIITGLLFHKATIKVLALNTSAHLVDIKEIPDEIKSNIDLSLCYIDTGISYKKLFINLLLSNKPFNLERFRSCQFETGLNLALENEFDIIQFEGLAMYHYLPNIRKKSSAITVLRPHNVENIIWSGLAAEDKNLLKKFYFRILARRIKKIEKKIINQFDAFVPITTTDLNWFKDNGATIKSLVCTPGIDTRKITSYSDKDSAKVCFIGSLDWRPNLNGLFWFIKKVWPLIFKKVPEASFYVAGRNASDKTIRKLRNYGVKYCGEVDSSTDFLNDKSVLVVPLFTGSGIRMKILEGMACGMSIVSTPVGANGLDYKAEKNIFIASSREEFANFVTNLLSDKELRRETGINAIENVRKNYNILASAENLLGFYSELTT